MLVFDTDSPPVLPLRCHQLFDDTQRPLWASWPNRNGLRWVGASDKLLLQLVRGVEQGHPALRPVAPLLGNGSRAALRATAHLDFMTYFPVVLPRALLRATRALLCAACAAGLLDGPPAGHPAVTGGAPLVGLQHGAQLRQDGACADFDRVWLALGRPSYADLLAKASQLLPASADAAVQWVHCPANPTLRGACRDWVTPAPHVKYPSGSGSLTRAQAAAFGARLARQAQRFARGDGTLPAELFVYNLSRPASVIRAISRRVLRPDPPGLVCGRPGVWEDSAPRGGKRGKREARDASSSKRAGRVSS